MYLKGFLLCLLTGALSWGQPFSLQPNRPVPPATLSFVNPIAHRGGHLRLTDAYIFDNVNPFTVFGNIVAGLYWTKATLMMASPEDPTVGLPFIATGVREENQGEETVFHVLLHPSARFSDGTPVRPEDVVATFYAVLKKGSPFYRAALAEIKAVRAMEGGVEIITDSKGRPSVFDFLTQVHILPQSFLDRHDIGRPFLGFLPTAGAYKMTFVSPSKAVEYTRMTPWWGDVLPSMRGLFNFDRVSYTYFFNHQAAFEALKSHQVDFKQEFSTNTWEKGYDFEGYHLGKLKKVAVPSREASGTLGFGFNFAKDKFKDVRVRLAISLMLNTSWIIKTYFSNRKLPLKTFFPETGYSTEEVAGLEEKEILEQFYKDRAPQDLPPLEKVLTSLPPLHTSGEGAIPRETVEKAIQLLDEAGWTLKDGQLILKVSGEPFTLEILSNVQTVIKSTNPFMENLKALGMDVSYRYADAAQYEHRVAHGDFDMVASWVGPGSIASPAPLHQSFHSSSVNQGSFTNYLHIQDPDIDFILESMDWENLEPWIKVLDRMLLWKMYIIPKWREKDHLYAYWAPLTPPSSFPKEGVAIIAWSFDPAQSPEGHLGSGLGVEPIIRQV